MAITTYTELKSAVSDWLNRDDLDAVLDSFIALAEASFSRILRVRQMITRTTLPTSGQYLDLPSDFLEIFNIQLGSEPLQYLSPEILDQMRAGDDTSADSCYYTIVGSQIELYPTPADGSSLELSYYARIPALSDVQATNWLLASSPDVYLYGALTQSAPYLKEDPRAQVWSQLAQSALQQLTIAEDDSRHGGHTLRVSSSRTFG